MAAADAPATLSELRTDMLEKLKDVTGNSAINTIIDRFLNQANQDMHEERWPWSERSATLRTVTPYSTGTVDVAVTNSTTRVTVTGTSTVWSTTNSFGDANVTARDKIILGDSAQVHIVSTVAATSITLDSSTPFTGDSALDDASYTAYRDEYTPASDFSHPNPIDTRFFDRNRSIALVGRYEFYRMYPRNNVRGRPRHATTIELGPSASVALRPRIVLGPAPDDTYVIPYLYTTTNLAVSTTGTLAANMSATTDEPICPLKWRQGIVFKALHLWYSSRQVNAELASQWKGAYDELILRARAATGKADPRPRFVPQVSSYRAHYGRTRGRLSRYDGGTAYDEMRY